MSTNNRIGLRIPDQTPARGGAFYLHERDLSEWIENLPLANIGETSRRIFQALREFNRTLAPARKRLVCAEKFREPVGYVGSSLGKHYLDVGFPLTEKAHRIAILNRELNSGLATAFKCVVVDLLLEQQGKPDRKLLTIAIHRALYYLSQVLLLSVLVYDSCPKRTWRELHVLHRLACRYGLDATPVRDSLDPQGGSTSIDEAYRRCVLFSLASPYKMRQRENIQVFDALHDWARYAQLYSSDDAPSETTILIRQDSDLPPSHESLSHDADSHYLLKMDASGLIDKLREQFDENPVGQELPGVGSLDKNLLRQLIQLWSTAQKRSFVRTKLNFELRIAVGLNSIHQLIEASAFLADDPHGQHLDAEATESSDRVTWIEKNFAEGVGLEFSPNFSLQPIDKPQHHEHRRSDFDVFGPASRELDEPDPASSIWDQQNDKTSGEFTHIFHTLNESAGGYCLDWRGERIPKILVGELIGIQTTKGHNQFGVGLVRWMRSNPHESMRVGLQMIAPNAIAVTATRDSNGSGVRTSGGAAVARIGASRQKCLLLPEVGTSGQPTSIICPSFAFKVGDILSVDDGDNSHDVKLTRLLESSGAITQFQFIYLGQPELPEETDEEDDLGDDADFESLWTTL